jgi:hypothetical protein
MLTSRRPSFAPNRTFGASLQRSAVPALALKNSVGLHEHTTGLAVQNTVPPLAVDGEGRRQLDRRGVGAICSDKRTVCATRVGLWKLQRSVFRAGAGSALPSRGSDIMACIPAPLWENEISPPCCRATARAIERPRPIPPVSLFREVSNRKKGAKTFSRISAGIPGPRSSTTMSIVDAVRRIYTFASPP